VLALLAWLDSEQALPALLLDEVGASLDETRLAALGQAFARLAQRRVCGRCSRSPRARPSHVVSLSGRTLRRA